MHIFQQKNVGNQIYQIKSGIGLYEEIFIDWTNDSVGLHFIDWQTLKAFVQHKLGSLSVEKNLAGILKINTLFRMFLLWYF